MNYLIKASVIVTLGLVSHSLKSQAIVHAENKFQTRYRCTEKKETYPKLRVDVSFNRITKQWKAETFHETASFHPAHPDRDILKNLHQFDIRPETSKLSDPGAIEHEFVDYKSKGEEFSLKMKRVDPEPDYHATMKLKEESSELVCRTLIRAMKSGS